MHKRRYIAGIIGVIILIAFAYYFSFIVKWVLISAFISMIGEPLVELILKIKIKKFKFPRWLASLITIISLYLAIFIIIGIITPFIVNEVQQFQSIDVEAIREGLKKPIKNINDFIKNSPIINQPNFNVEDFAIEKITKIINLTSIGNFINDFGSAIVDFFIAIFSITFITFFFLKDKDLFSRGVIALVPRKYEQKTANVLSSLRKLISRYLIGIIIETALITILFTSGLYIIGIDLNLAILIGIISGILNIIPYIGPWMGAFVAIVLVTTANINMDFYTVILPYFYKIAIVYALSQLIDNNVFQPFIYSKSVKAHPLEIFIVIIIAGNLYGIIGMMLAIPAYTVIRVIAKEFFNQYKIIQKLTKNIDNGNSIKNEDL